MISEGAANSDSNERILLYDIWKVLDGEVREAVMIEDVRVLLMAIMRITDHKRIGVEKPELLEEQENKRLTQNTFEDQGYGVGFFNEKS